MLHMTDICTYHISRIQCKSPLSQTLIHLLLCMQREILIIEYIVYITNQSSLCCDLRIQLFETTTTCISGIDKADESLVDFLCIEIVKNRFWHHNFSSDTYQIRVSSRKLFGYCIQWHDICCHILSDPTITTSDSLGEYAITINQFDSHTIVFGLTHKIHIKIV